MLAPGNPAPVSVQYGAVGPTNGTGDSTPRPMSGTADAQGRTTALGDRTTPTAPMFMPVGGLGDRTLAPNAATDLTLPPGYEYVTGIRQRQAQCAATLPWMPQDQNFGNFFAAGQVPVQAAGFAGPGGETVTFAVFAAWAAFLLGTAAGYKAIRRNYEKND